MLTDDEVRRIWTVLDTRDEELDRFVPIIRLGLLTGQREGEIMGMRWSELDLEHGWWTIPGERTKNGLIHRVPLVGEALAVLKGIFAGQHDSVLVFPGGRRGQPLRSVYKPMLRLKKLSSVGGFRYHDLRRTARTGWASIGIDDSLAERLLNHNDRGVQGVYNRYKYDADKRAALARWICGCGRSRRARFRRRLCNCTRENSSPGAAIVTAHSRTRTGENRLGSMGFFGSSFGSRLPYLGFVIMRHARGALWQQQTKYRRSRTR